MTLWQSALIALATLALLGTTAALALAVIKCKARALAGYAPEIAILCERLISDPRVSPIDKLKLRALAWYLSLRLDLIPDFIPVIGRLDDALVVAVSIRTAHVRRPRPDPPTVARATTGPQQHSASRTGTRAARQRLVERVDLNNPLPICALAECRTLATESLSRLESTHATCERPTSRPTGERDRRAA